jgi:hypothetical protein
MKMRKIFLYAKTCIFQKEYEQDIKPRLSDKITYCTSSKCSSPAAISIPTTAQGE